MLDFFYELVTLDPCKLKISHGGSTKVKDPAKVVLKQQSFIYKPCFSNSWWPHACATTGRGLLVVRAKQQEKEKTDGNPFAANVAQLLGIRGGSQTADKWKIRLQLTKPVTWIPLIWGTTWNSPCFNECILSLSLDEKVRQQADNAVKLAGLAGEAAALGVGTISSSDDTNCMKSAL